MTDMMNPKVVSDLAHWMPMKKSEFWTALNHLAKKTYLPGSNWHKIDLKMKRNSILFYFNLYIIYGRSRQKWRGRADDQQGEPS